MKISSKARYGLKAMCFMAKHYNGDVIALSVIADGISVSEKYLEQLLATLKKAEIVGASRGANGGYYLTRSAQDISVGEILRALEDGLKIIDCIEGECSSQCGGSQKCDCNTYDVWNKLYQAINSCLDNMSLASIITK